MVENDENENIGALAYEIVKAIQSIDYTPATDQDIDSIVQQAYQIFSEVNRVIIENRQSSHENFDPSNLSKKLKTNIQTSIKEANTTAHSLGNMADFRSAMIKLVNHKMIAQLRQDQEQLLLSRIQDRLAEEDKKAENTINKMVEIAVAMLKAPNSTAFPEVEVLKELSNEALKFSYKSLQYLKKAYVDRAKSENIPFIIFKADEEVSTAKAIAFMTDVQQLAEKHLEQGKNTAQQILKNLKTIVDKANTNLVLLKKIDKNDTETQKVQEFWNSLKDIPEAISAILYPFKQKTTEGSKSFF
jgi:hypothetical protein